MKTLDQSQMEGMGASPQLCAPTFSRCAIFDPCGIIFRCPEFGVNDCDGAFRPCFGVRPMIKHFPAQLAESLKACGGEFYDRCPEFGRLEQMCDFEPAIEAARRKEQALQDRIKALESRVQELELTKKG